MAFATDTSVAIAPLVLSHSPNTAYTAHFVRPNFGYAESSYMLGTLYEMAAEMTTMKNGENKP